MPQNTEFHNSVIERKVKNWGKKKKKGRKKAGAG